MDFDTKILKPGDCLLYRPSGFFGRIIAIKTWNRISHVEIYAGKGQSVASRDGIGIDIYPFRSKGLGYILRPTHKINMKKAMYWFYREARGQKYDWKGLLVFALAVKQGAMDRMFCSEFATRFYRKGKIRPFAENYNADMIAPANFLMSPSFHEIWKDVNI